MMIMMIMIMIMLIIGPWLMATIMINLLFHSELDRSKESGGEVENLMDMPLSMVKSLVIINVIAFLVVIIIYIIAFIIIIIGSNIMIK